MVPFSPEHRADGVSAHARFAKGRQAVGLDVGGCPTFAVAHFTGQPLQCAGTDLPRPPAPHRSRGEDEPGRSPCPLCDRLLKKEEFVGDALTAALWDSFPVNPGHALVIPRRHVADYFALSQEEKQEIWRVVDAAKERIERDFLPQGFNIGINVGAAAGQTIFHVHVHVIPRYTGDVEDPRGGVRWVIRARAPYWKDAAP